MGDKKIELYTGVTSYRNLKVEMARHKLNVKDYMIFKKGDHTAKKFVENLGLESVITRMENLPEYLDECGKVFSKNSTRDAT